MYKITIGKKYITISPKPLKTIPYAIKAELNRSYDKTSTPIITADLIEGKTRYSLPYLPEGLKIIKAYINER